MGQGGSAGTGSFNFGGFSGAGTGSAFGSLPPSDPSKTAGLWGSTGLGAPNTSYFHAPGANRSFSTINTALTANPNQEDTHHMLEYLEKAYDRKSQFYKFIYTFYDVLEEGKAKPPRPLDVPQEIWDQAEKQNPSPETLSPFVAFGYEGLYERLSQQKSVIERLGGSRKYLGERVNELV